MEHELEEVERDYIEFRKEIGEENQERVENRIQKTRLTHLKLKLSNYKLIIF